MYKYLAVIPAYNESTHIQQVVQLIKGTVPVLVVDDGSVDDTSFQAELGGASVLQLSPNQGKGAALRAGFRKALELGYDAVITLDGDGQHDPSEINKFVQAYDTLSADLVIGARDFRKMPLLRRLANTLGQYLFSWMLGSHIPDNQSGYRLLSRRMMQALLDSSENGFEFEVEMFPICLKNNFSLTWVPISTIYSGETSHIQPLRHTVNFVRIIWLTYKKMRDHAV